MRYRKYHTPKRHNRRARISLPKLGNPLALKNSNQKPDYVLIGSIGLLLLVGIVMLSSASSVLSYQRFGEVYYYFRHQLLYGIIPGVIAFFFFLHFDYRRLQRYTLWFLVAAIAILVLVFIPGLRAEFGTARSWIQVGGVSLQPSEIVKLFVILFFAGWFAEREYDLNSDFWNGLVPFTGILGVIALLVAMQPDFGTLSVIGSIAMVMYFVSGARWTHLIGLSVAGIGALGILLSRSSHTIARLTTFLHPELDPQGIGYHINQAFLAVGSGGLFGVGFGQSRQKFAYLPEVMGDSIFAIIAEELGFFLSAAVLLLFVVAMVRSMRLVKNTDDMYAKFIVVGIITWFVMQAFFNIAAMVGLLPLTGIPLPFISYGGTAMVASLAAVGILANISRNVRV